LAVANGYKNVYWLRDGIKGWQNAGYATVGKLDLLNDLIDVNKIDFPTLLITEKDARMLKNCCFVDFREKSKYEQNHIKGANHVDYSNMFSKPMMEELNKSDSLVIVHDDQTVSGVIAMTLKLMDYPNVYILK
jgi:rhodanese-related sulfurtransferase